MSDREVSALPVAGLAAIMAGLAMGVALLAIIAVSLHDDDTTLTAAVGPALPIELSDFAIDPDPAVVAPGGSLAVTNVGNTAHNLAIEGIEVATADLPPLASETLPLASLPEGDYVVYCTIAGHRDAGMESALTVSASAEPTPHHGDDAEADWAALDQVMLDSVARFPQETEGVGNVPLEPAEILADGTKVFDLTTEITPWEVEPGKFVDAWTYNGMVPGPWIDVEVGDNVRINVHNRLPMGTDIHWHGIVTPNEMDGVSPITQDLIRPGEDFTYEFEAKEVSLGMYHAHHHGHVQIPNGLFGVFSIGELPLPRGEVIGGREIPADLEIAQEIPMVLNDAGVIGLSLNGKSFPATAPIVGETGDWVQVTYFNEGLLIHPMHQHRFGQLVIAKDGFPLDHPYWADTINVAPGERYTVLIPMEEAGTWVWHCHILNHVERDDGMFGMVTAMVVTDPEATS